MPGPKDPIKYELWKKRLSKAHTGKKLGKSWNKGLTKDTDPRVASQGRIFTDEMKQQMSEATMGRIRSKESRLKQSKTMSGKENHRYTNGINTMNKYMKKTYKECYLCKSKKDLQMHHKDHDTDNNKKYNVVIICWDCHVFWHRIGDSI